MRIHQYISKIAGILTILLGSLVLVAWIFNVPGILHLIPNAAPMQANTAICFILLGIRLLLVYVENKNILKISLTLSVALIASIILFEYISNIQLPLDTFLFPNNTSHTGRMAPNTALCFLLLSTGLCFSDRGEVLKFISLFLASITFILSAAAFSGYLLNINVLYGWSNFSRMTIYTSAGMMLVSSVLLHNLFSPDFVKLPLKKIRNYILVYGIISILIMAILSAFLTFLPLFQRLGDYEKENLLTILSNKANAIDQYFEELRNISKLLSSRTYLNDVLKDYEAKKIPLSTLQERYKKNLQEALNTTSQIKGITRFNLKHEKIFEIGFVPPLHYEKIISDYSPDKEYPITEWTDSHQILNLVYANPVFDENKTRIATDVVCYSSTRIEKIIKDYQSSFKSTSLYLLIPYEKGVDFFEIKNNVLIKSDGKNNDNHNFRNAVSHVTQNKHGIIDQNNGLMADQIYTYYPLSQKGWGIIGKIDSAEIFEDLNKPLLIVFICVGSFILVFTIGYIILIKPLTGGILIQEFKLEETIEEKTLLLQNELELRKAAEERLQSILDNTSAVIYAKSAEGHYLLINKQFEKLFHVNAEKVLSKTDYDIFTKDFADTYRKNDLEVIEKNEIIHREENVIQDDGMHTYISIKFPLRDLNGKPYAVCGISTDITQQKRNADAIRKQNLDLEAKNKSILENTERLESLQMSTLNLLEDLQNTKDDLLKSKEELSRSNNELEQFAYVASHDLQEPLRKIMAFSERLVSKTQGKLDVDEKDYLARMVSAANRMRNLIEDLLTYSRLNTQKPSFETVDLNSVLEGVLSDLETRIEQSKGLITHDQLPSVEAIPLQMRQLLQNIISNALKFHKSGQGTKIGIKSKIENNKLMITISDDGIGFDIKFKERIFQPFQRLHGRSEYEGTGIGLAVCKKIIERHHGSIEVESEENKGSTFTIIMPLKQDERNA